LLTVDQVTFRYRERSQPAIQKVSFTVHPGEIVLLAGPSGCGKTTLARCINGLIPRSYEGDLSGRILLQGEDASQKTLPQISQIIGTVLQDPERQILGTKVKTEVAFGLENMGLPRQEILERVDVAMEHLRINHLAERETFNLSGGEKQKVALAGVLAMSPGLLMLDEPLASLDPASAVDALNLIRRLADEGMGVLMVEHRVEDVLKINPDRVMFMLDGHIVYDGSVEGMTRKVNYHAVKLPAQIVMERAAQDPPPQPIEPLANVTRDKSSPLVTFKNVSFAYEKAKPVLHDINLDIFPGDVVAVLGPNGAGKTTFVKHAIGLLKPTHGQVFVEGTDTHDMSVAEIAKTLGYVFQSPSHMLFAPSVRAELGFGPKNLGHKPEKIDKEVQRAIEIMNLIGMEDNPPLGLSFGQQKRVSIASVLAMQSKILIMDEPTAGQDYQNYMEFMDSILQLPSFEAILFITHDIDLAVIYANRVLLINDGRLAGDGKPQDVLSDYDYLRSCRLIPTTLLDANRELLDQTGHFMRAEALAHVAS
jgi:energy-coupling factor transport system ATP-binding protein